jgi:coenzyme PQQ precursor peptide PqqA
MSVVFGRDKTMEWTTPKFEEIALNCEINSYASAALYISFLRRDDFPVTNPRIRLLLFILKSRSDKFVDKVTAIRSCYSPASHPTCADLTKLLPKRDINIWTSGYVRSGCKNTHRSDCKNTLESANALQS